VKIFTLKEDLLGKKIYKDRRLERLKNKFNPPKVTYFSVEFTNQDRDSCDSLLIEKGELLDFIVEDIERAETLLNKVEDKRIVQQALDVLEKEQPLSLTLDKETSDSLRNYNFITLKPIVFIKESEDLNSLLERIFKAGHFKFFFTVNKNEAKAWVITEGADIINCAAKIHTDLAKGFIKGEVYNIKDLDHFHNLEEARQKGFLKVVGRDYIVIDGDVINIKFKV
jgi:ribosome-binding ATPase YchF (GTP1/OBG family)